MCGIVGVAGDITPAWKKAFEQLLIVDQLRGSHSTGLMQVTGYNNEVNVVKVVGDPLNLMSHKNYDKATNMASKVLLGHNRWATSGKITAQNAHPFEFDIVTGVHNGTLLNYRSLPDANVFDVDSAALYNGINELGIEEAISKVTGAYALVWWNSVEKTLNFLRNNDRTLFMARSEDEKTIIWASEKGMLSWILERNNLKTKELGLLKPDVWFSFDMKNNYPKVPMVATHTELKGGTALNRPVNLFPQQNQRVVQTNVIKPETSVLKEIDPKIVGLKTHLFKCGKPGITHLGAKYINLESLEGIEGNFRLFIKHSDYGQYLVGDECVGDVKEGVKDGINNEVYYKLSYSSVVNVSADDRQNLKKVEEEAKEIVKNLSLVPKVTPPPAAPSKQVFYPDWSGKFLTKEEWEKRHGYCSCCFEKIDVEAKYEFVGVGSDILCGECITDPVLVRSFS